MFSGFSRARALCALLGSTLFIFQADAQDAEPAAPAGPELRYQTGDIVLPSSVASLHLDAAYRYLDPKETEKLLVAWGNPPEAAKDIEGAIVPSAIDPFSDNGWAVVLSYVKDGHIDDSDAREIDYKELLSQMQEETRASNEERKKAGYGTVELVGWAAEPRYDSTARKLFWAKELKFSGAPVSTLNYDVRVLGREGVLSMNAVASMTQLSDIQRDMQSLLKVAEFNPGHRYEEYNSKTDKLAAYGLGALVAGGVAAKMGLFAKLFALVLAFKKIIIVAVVAVGGFLVRLFTGRSKSEPTPG